MDILTFITEMTKALAWPVVVALSIFLLKDTFTGLIRGVKLKRIEKGEFRADFETVAQEIREDLPVVERAQITKVIPSSLQSKIENLVSSSPYQAIAQTWNQIEGRINSSAARIKISRGDVADILNTMTAKGMIEDSTRDSLTGLYKLRNLAIHGDPRKVTSKEAREYIVMAEAALWSMEQNLKKSKGSAN